MLALEYQLEYRPAEKYCIEDFLSSNERIYRTTGCASVWECWYYQMMIALASILSCSATRHTCGRLVHELSLPDPIKRWFSLMFKRRVAKY